MYNAQFHYYNHKLNNLLKLRYIVNHIFFTLNIKKFTKMINHNSHLSKLNKYQHQYDMLHNLRYKPLHMQYQ